MLIVKVRAESKSYYRSIITKFKRIREKHPLHVDVLKANEYILIFSLDDGFSATFVYYAYLLARKYDLDADLLYARYIEPDQLPQEIRRMGKKWLQRRLDEEEVENLKRISITEHMLGVTTS